MLQRISVSGNYKQRLKRCSKSWKGDKTRESDKLGLLRDVKEHEFYSINTRRILKRQWHDLTCVFIKTIDFLRVPKEWAG